jgi:hypothetical protein
MVGSPVVPAPVVVGLCVGLDVVGAGVVVVVVVVVVVEVVVLVVVVVEPHPEFSQSTASINGPAIALPVGLVKSQYIQLLRYSPF